MKYLGRIGRVQFTGEFDPRAFTIGIYKGRAYWEMGQLYRPWRVCLTVIALRVTIRLRPRREGDEL